MPPLPVIGIDLGTTYSCVGCLKNGRVEIIANSHGERTTSSTVAYVKNSSEVIVGSPATHQIARNAENTFYDSKRVIGKIFGDPTIDGDIEKFPFTIIKEPNYEKSGKAVFAVTNGHQFSDSPGKNWVSPQEVASEILKSLKASAESYIGSEVRHAVVTVPAYFNNDQRKATKQAGEMAGLNVLQLLNEPTAAALAYGEYGEDISKNPNTSKQRTKTILVFDLGGGTFDVSLLKLEDHEYEVIAVDGDNHLGGEDFTNLMVDQLLKEFSQTVGKPVDELLQNTRVVRRLREQCEKAKRVLSSSKTAMIEIENLLGDYDLYTSMDQHTFEKICEHLFDKLKRPLDTVLDISKTDKSKVDDIVLVGGATRMPKVKEMLRKYFDKDELKETVNADEAVAFGATILAITLAKNRIEELDEEVIRKQLQEMSINNENSHSNIVLREVTPMTISMETACRMCDLLIPRRTPIPVVKTQIFNAPYAHKGSVLFNLLEGESLLAEKNNMLGSFTIENMSGRLYGETKASVTISIDLDGILEVTAYKIDNSKKGFSGLNEAEKPRKELVIENVTNSLTTEERLKMIQRHMNDELEDEQEYRRRWTFSELYDAMKNGLHDLSAKNISLSPEQQTVIDKMEDIYYSFLDFDKHTRWEVISKLLRIKELDPFLLSTPNPKDTLSTATASTSQSQTTFSSTVSYPKKKKLNLF